MYVYIYIHTLNQNTEIYKVTTIELKRETDKNTIIVGDLSSSLTALDRSSKQKKINKEISALNDALGQMKIIDIYRAFHPRISHNTFFSSAHGTLQG